MPQSRGLHHVDLVVSELARSLDFYSDLLRPLGWGPVLELVGERGEEIWYLQAQDTWLGLRQKQSDAHRVPYDRYAVGAHPSPSRRSAARQSTPAPPEEAERLYDAFCSALRELGVEVATGVFGARMEVELVDDGPVTNVHEDR